MKKLIINEEQPSKSIIKVCQFLKLCSVKEYNI